MLPEVIALDVETTGLDSSSHIVELGLVGADKVFIETFAVCFRVYTDKPFEQWKEASEASHGLEMKDVRDALSINQVKEVVDPLFEGNPLLVGHNIRSYDLGIIEDTPLEECVVGCDVFDTMKDVDYDTSKWLSLEKAARAVGEKHSGAAHSAIHDARTSLRIARTQV